VSFDGRKDDRQRQRLKALTVWLTAHFALMAHIALTARFARVSRSPFAHSEILPLSAHGLWSGPFEWDEAPSVTHWSTLARLGASAALPVRSLRDLSVVLARRAVVDREVGLADLLIPRRRSD